MDNDTIEEIAKSQADLIAGPAIATAEIGAFVLVKLVRAGLATDAEVKEYFEQLVATKPNDMERRVYELVLNRLFGMPDEKPEVPVS